MTFHCNFKNCKKLCEISKNRFNGTHRKVKRKLNLSSIFTRECVYIIQHTSSNIAQLQAVDKLTAKRIYAKRDQIHCFCFLFYFIINFLHNKCWCVSITLKAKLCFNLHKLAIILSLIIFYPIERTTQRQQIHSCAWTFQSSYFLSHIHQHTLATDRSTQT